MAKLVTAIRTDEGDLKIDYIEAIENKPYIPSDVVHYVEQTLGDEQKAVARNNIGAASTSHAESHYPGGSDALDLNKLGVAGITTLQAKTLPASGWGAPIKVKDESGNETDEVYYEMNLAVDGVSADEDTQLISISPVPSTQVAYADAGITATKQELNQITFTAATLPTEDLLVYVVIQSIKNLDKQDEGVEA